MISQEELKQTLHYDPDTGLLTWLAARGRIRAGDVAGSDVFFKTNKKYYSQVSINNKRYLSHRIIWFYMTGEWPDEVDHEDGDGLNNRWLNLRHVDGLENCKNKRVYCNNTSGVTGVTVHGRKWKAELRCNKVKYYLGLFEDFFEAVCARKSAELRHGFHPNHGSHRPL